MAAFLTASYLTDPICKTHEFYRRLFTVEALNPMTAKASIFIKKLFIVIGMLLCASIGSMMALPAIAIRYCTIKVQSLPYLYSLKAEVPKNLPPDGTFSLLSWNICGIHGGYPISNGGVTAWPNRIDKIIDKIIEKNADVNCLYEIFDIKTALYIQTRLKQKGYADCFYNIGPTAVGVSSGIMVISKYTITSPEFTRFPKDSLVGRTKNAVKGVFAFDLKSQGRSFARIHATHLQHSEEPGFPTAEEVFARRKQMEIILNKVVKVANKCIVVTGDLNLDDAEYQASSWQTYFQKGDHYPQNRKTWGGDGWCATMTNSKISGPLNLDHTMVVNQTARSIHTSLVEAGFDGSQFKQDALSDHNGIFSMIEI